MNIRTMIRAAALLCTVFLLALCPAARAGETDSLFTNDTFTELPEKGFVVPLPEGEAWEGGADRGSMGLFAEIHSADPSGWIRTIRYYHRALDNFVAPENPAENYYDQIDFSDERDVRTETIEIDGKPVRLVTFAYDRFGEQFGAYGGILMYAREKQMLQIRVYSENPGKKETEVPPVSMETLKLLASKIRYDLEQAPIRHSDVELTIAEETGATAVTPGKSLKLRAVFGNSEIVAQEGSDEVVWEVLDERTGEESVNADISAGGTLTAHRGVEGPIRLKVRAESTVFHTKAEYSVVIVNPAEDIRLESEPLVFYAGSGASATLRAGLLPQDMLPIGLIWSASRPDVVAIEPGANGEAVIRPLNPGKIRVSVREPGGKSAAVKVTVLQPVKQIKLSYNKKAKPGTSVKIAAWVLPDDASSKKVTWSVNVDPSVAKIDKKGKLVISKDALVGTVILVTCESDKAPEKVISTIQVVVVEK